jgi:hypothetical protein
MDSLEKGNKLFKKWKKSEAMVVRNIYMPNKLALFKPNDPDDDETGAYYAVIEFKTAKDEMITKQLDIGGYPPRRVGQRMLVIYNPSNPLDFVTYPRTKFKVIPRLLMAIGLVGLLVSFADLFGLISIIPD